MPASGSWRRRRWRAYPSVRICATPRVHRVCASAMLSAEWQRIVGVIGATVRELRLLLGWSQTELADRAVTSQGTVSRLESGRVPDVPLHSVVVVLRVLAAGADELDLELSPPVRTLLTFAQTVNPTFLVTAPLDPSLVRLLQIYHRLGPTQRLRFVEFLRATAAFVDGAPVREESVPLRLIGPILSR